MADYIKRELAVSSIALESDMSLEQARKILGNVPSIDITFCKDCEYAMTQDCPMDEQYDDDYCPYGAKRRKDETD